MASVEFSKVLSFFKALSDESLRWSPDVLPVYELAEDGDGRSDEARYDARAA